MPPDKPAAFDVHRQRASLPVAAERGLVDLGGSCQLQKRQRCPAGEGVQDLLRDVVRRAGHGLHRRS